MVDDNIVEASIRLEVLSHDDDDNQHSPARSQSQDILLNRVQTPPITRSRSRSPYTASSPGLNRNIMTTPSSAQLIDENRYLNDELNRVETILNLTRAEKDEL
ncbi:unnamed protein product, partial [Rotaria sp. Silwood1]